MCELSPVPFHGDTIFCVTIENQPYTPAKPIIINIGLDWQAQATKLRNNKERWGVVIIAIPSESGDQETTCIPVRKLPAFLASINPKKVKPELRERIELYQAECDDALWNYWMNGKAERPTPEPSPLSKRTDPERKALTAIINTWVGMAPIHYANARAQVNAHFGVTSVDKLTVAQVKEAIAWVQGKIDALPPAREQLALPSHSVLLDERVNKVRGLVAEMNVKRRDFLLALQEVEFAVRFRPAKMDTMVSPLSKTLERHLPVLSMTASLNMNALCDMLEVYCATLAAKE